MQIDSQQQYSLHLHSSDEHTIALFTYFVVFNDLQYSRDLRQHYTTRTILQDVFRATGSLHDVIPTISDHFRGFYGISNVCLLISDLLLHQWTIYAFPILQYTYSMCSRHSPTLFRFYLSLEISIFRCFNYLQFWLIVLLLQVRTLIPMDYQYTARHLIGPG